MFEDRLLGLICVLTGALLLAGYLGQDNSLLGGIALILLAIDMIAVVVYIAIMASEVHISIS